MTFASIRSAVLATAVAGLASSALAEPNRPLMGNMQAITSRSLETFVPADVDAVPIAAIELRTAAEIRGGTGEVTLREVCRWAEADNDRFAAVADVVVLRFQPGSGFATLDIEQVQQALADAGMGPGSINFSGALRCTVSRADVAVDEGEALRQWVRTSGDVPSQVKTRTEVVSIHPERSPATATEQPALESKAPAPAIAADAAPLTIVQPAAAEAATRGDLRAMLISDIAARTGIPVTRLQVDFAASDRALLSLATPTRFTVEPQRYGDLGETTWYVTIDAGNGEPRRVRVRATARAWIDQVVLKRSINTREAIGPEDVEQRNVLADRLAPDQLASADKAVGQQAARELRAGTILTDRMLAPMEMVRSGQAVTVTMRRGAIQIRSVATALQSGSLGDTVRVRNPSTNEIYQVQLTGPQIGTVPSSDPIIADANN